MEHAEVKPIVHGSPEYEAEVALRDSVLRQPLGLSFSAEQLSAEADSHHIGCFIDGRLAGCLVLKPVDERRIRMRQVAVDAQVRGRGVGKMLVRYSEDFAGKLGFHEMVLHAREAAVAFYEQLAYVKVGDCFTEVTIPHWVMAKALSAEPGRSSGPP